ncbi:MAG: hypothetical protein GXP60_06815 [Epsilonproteobacteria bacterium]|nr:hypothetical protein [Campylobacterota bacterium]
MEDYSWLSAFLDISEAIFKNLYGKAGSAEMAASIGKGAGGDTTIQIDRSAEDIFIEKFESFNISAVIISEEAGKIFVSGGDDNSPIVLIDPIDGSMNAKRGLPFYSVAIAKTEKMISSTTVSVVMNLSNGDRFYAIKDRGAFKDNYFLTRHGKAAGQIKTDGDATKEILITEGIYEDAVLKEFLIYRKMFDKIRVFGSVALDLSYLADSAADGFVHPLDSRTFDYAAGKLILEEAGGCLSNQSGESFDVDVNLKKGSPFIAARNREILNDMVKAKINFQEEKIV